MTYWHEVRFTEGLSRASVGIGATLYGATLTCRGFQIAASMYGILRICSLLLVLPCCYGIEYSHFSSFNGGNYTVGWKFVNETEMFYFKVEVNATGWIGFGISRLLWPRSENLQWNRNSMLYYDVIVGGMTENKTQYFKVSLNLVFFVSDNMFE